MDSVSQVGAPLESMSRLVTPAASSIWSDWEVSQDRLAAIVARTLSPSQYEALAAQPEGRWERSVAHTYTRAVEWPLESSDLAVADCISKVVSEFLFSINEIAWRDQFGVVLDDVMRATERCTHDLTGATAAVLLAVYFAEPALLESGSERELHRRRPVIQAFLGCGTRCSDQDYADAGVQLADLLFSE